MKKFKGFISSIVIIFDTIAWISVHQTTHLIPLILRLFRFSHGQWRIKDGLCWNRDYIFPSTLTGSIKIVISREDFFFSSFFLILILFLTINFVN